MGADYRAFVEIVFENRENIMQSWHLDGYSFFVVGMDQGSWTPSCRNQYNLTDAVPRSTAQVYPKSWTAIYVALDNVGMWNLRSESWTAIYCDGPCGCSHNVISAQCSGGQSEEIQPSVGKRRE